MCTTRIRVHTLIPWAIMFPPLGRNHCFPRVLLVTSHIKVSMTTRSLGLPFFFFFLNHSMISFRLIRWGVLLVPQLLR